MEDCLIIESQNGSKRIADTNYHRVNFKVLEVVSAAVIAKLREKGVSADSGSGTAKVVTIALSGTGGTALVKFFNLVLTLTFNTDLTTTASDFVTANSAAFTALGITLTSSTNNLIFTAVVAGIPFSNPTITKETVDLFGVVSITTADVTTPLIAHNCSGSLAAGEKVYATTEFEGIQLTSGTIMVR